MSRTCHAPNIDILVHGDDEAVHDDRGDDGSVAAGEKDHHVGDEGVLHRTLNDSAHRADTFHSTVSANIILKKERDDGAFFILLNNALGTKMKPKFKTN